MVDDGADESYPSHWEADVLLRDGSTKHIRPIWPSDAEALRRFHERQSDESIYFRFFAPMKSLPDSELHRFTHVDHRDRVALVLVEGSEIMAVGRFDRIDEHEAEVAFNVSDHHQGKGIGSVLLEHLAAAGRELGIGRFVADVLPANTKMLAVFADAGFAVSQRYDEGVISVSFRIDPTARSLGVMADREQRTEALSMGALLTATSVAVVAEPGPELPYALRACESILRSPFSGEVVLIGGPLREEAEGSRALWFPDLPAAVEGTSQVDVAVVALAPERVMQVLAELGQRSDGGLGAHGVVLVSGGFSSDDTPGDVPQRELVRAARVAGIRLVGPRSYGLASRGEAGPLNATLWREGLRAGGVGLFCQSGAAGLALAASAHRRRIGVSTFVSTGHRADVSGNDAMQYWQIDSGTTVAALYLESFGNPRKFSRVARRLASLKPVVALVAGSTSDRGGARTSPASRPRRITDEMLRQSGVIKASSTHELLDVASLFASQPLPRGDRVAILTNSGSLAALIADEVDSRGLRVAESPIAMRALSGAEHYEQACEQLLAREDWDSLVVVHVPPLGERSEDVTRVIARSARRSGRTVVATVLGLHGLADELTDDGSCVPAYATVEDAVVALESAHQYARWLRAEHGELVEFDDIDRRGAKELVAEAMTDLEPGGRRRLSDADARALLAAYGITVWPAVPVRDVDEAVAAAEQCGWPVALKSTDLTLRHRADLGGVRLGISGAAELAEAMRQMTGEGVPPGRADLGGAQVEVQAMAPLGVACVVRGVEDGLYGPVVSFGLSGDAVELLDDVSYGIPPLTTVDVADMVRAVRASPRLSGYRGLPALDVAALEQVIARVSVLTDDLPEVCDVLLHPVLVAEAGAVALSVVVDVAEPERIDAGRRAMRV